MILVEWIQRKAPHGLYLRASMPAILRYGIYLTLIVLIVCFSGGQHDFIYFDF